jgi:hypothetical protein
MVFVPLQDALSDATSTDRSEAEKDGIKFFNYKIDSPVSDAVCVIQPVALS